MPVYDLLWLISLFLGVGREVSGMQLFHVNHIKLRPALVGVWRAFYVQMLQYVRVCLAN